MKTSILVLAGFMAALALSLARAADQGDQFQSTDSPSSKAWNTFSTTDDSPSSAAWNTFSFTTDDSPSSEARNTLSFTTDFEHSPHTLQMRKDLASPASRERLRNQHRRQILRQHPEVGTHVRLDAQEQEQLIDLLTEQQMRHLDLFYQETQEGSPARHRLLADNHKRSDAEQLALLGGERHELYRIYRLSASDRMAVAALEDRLDANDALTEQQKPALLELIRSQREQTMLDQQQNLSDALAILRTLPPPPDTAAPAGQQSAAKFTWQRQNNIELNERNLQRMEQASRTFLEKAAIILTPQQLERLAAIEAEKLDGQRRWLNDMRKQ